MPSSKLSIPVVTVDPVADADSVQVYCKDVGGVKQFFVRASDGTISQLSPVSSHPNPWVSSGIDGTQHFDGVATILGVAPATVDGVPNTYHFQRDLHLDVGSIVDLGVSVWVEDARFLWRGTLTNNGHVHNDGRPGIGRAGGSGSNTITFPAGNGAGGNGSNTGGPGGSGTASNTAPEAWTTEGPSAAGAPGAGKGQGGGGGDSGDGQTGGTGGGITRSTGPTRYDILTLFMGRPAAGGFGGTYTYGSGGGGGAVTGTAFASQGGGGGAGGPWFFAAGDILAGTGHMSCDGGKGADGVTNGGEPTVHAGGGGGGGGGIFGVMYGSNTGPNTITASGGIGGAAGSGGGAAGGNGSNGDLVKFSGDGT